MTRKNKSIKKRLGGRRKKSVRRMRGGDCGCGCASGGPWFKGGSQTFHDNGMPGSNVIPLNNGYWNNTDVQRMTESSRFVGGRCRKCGKRRRRMMRGGFSAIPDPLGGSSKDIVSAFGTSAGAQYNAQMASGNFPNGSDTGLFNRSIKPLA